jgi:hypothetical protein
MTAPSLSLTDQTLRRRQVMGAPVAHGASDHLTRSIGTFRVQLIGDLDDEESVRQLVKIWLPLTPRSLRKQLWRGR